MKKVFICVLVCLFLTGCAKEDKTLEPILQLRSRLLQSGCSFDLVITADYGDKTYSFTLGCAADEKGNVTFQVQEPQTIAGISGRITQGKGELTFDDAALAFELLADEQLSPVSAPWVLISTLRGGYIQSGGQAGDYYQVSLHDSYQENAMDLEVWLDQNGLPAQAEVLYEERRILTMEVKDFVIS